MSLISYTHDLDSIILRVKILNSSVTTGAGLTGLTFSSTGLIISTIADNEATATAYTVAASNVEDITTLGTYAAPTASKCRFKEVDSTNHKGVYEIQLADARFGVAAARSLMISISGATNAAETDVLVPLDSQVSIRTNIAAGGAAGSLTLDADASAVTDFYAGQNVTLIAGTGIGQTRTITAYNGSTKVATIVPNWATNPVSGTTFSVVDRGPVNVAVWRRAQPNALVSNRIDSSTGAMAANVLTGTAINAGAITGAKFAVDSGLVPIRSSVAQAGANNSITLDASSSSVTDFYAGKLILLVAGTGVGQSRICTAYNGSTKVATTVPDWATNPASGTTFAIVNHGDVNVASWRREPPSGLISNRVEAHTTVLAVDSVNSASIADTGSFEIGVASADAMALIATPIATLASQVSFTLTSGSADNDAYNGCVIVISDSVDSDQKAVGIVDDYEGSTQTITLLEDPGIFTMEAGDTVRIFPSRSLKPTAKQDYHVDVAATGEVGLDFANVAGTLTGGQLAVGAFASGAVTADAIAPDAIGASELATDAVNEIRDAILSDSTPFAGADVAAILTDTADMQPKLGTITDLGAGATVGDNLADMAGATFLTTTDSQEAIRDRGDAAWTTGAGGSDRFLMVDTTLTTVSSQTVMRLAAGSSDDGAYKGMTIIFENHLDANQKSHGVILEYTGATKEVELLWDPVVYTIAVDNKAYILADASVKPTFRNNFYLELAMGWAGIDWSNIKDATAIVNLSNTTVNAVATLANDSITAGVIAADAIGASELATDAVNEIRDAILSDSTPFAGASIATIVADTNELQTDWVDGGRLDSIVDDILVDTAEIGAAGAGLTAVSLANNSITSSTFANNAIDSMAIAANAIGNTQLASNAIGSAQIANNAITSSAFQSNAIDAGALATDAVNEIRDAILSDSTAFAGADIPAILADTSTIVDIYHAYVHLDIDELNTQDEYTVYWFKNGVAVTSGITLPKIQVIKRVDGTDLIAETAMTEVGSTGGMKYDEATNRITAGEAVIAVVKGTIDTSEREWRFLLGRDSS